MSLLRTLGVLSRSRFPQTLPTVAVVTPPPLSPSLRGTFVEKRHYHLSQSINSSHQEETFDVLQSLESQTHFGVAELESLQNQFVRKAGEDGVIDRSEFSDIMKGLGITDTMLVDRTFAAFDKDSSGDVDFREFVSGLSIITRGTSGDKFEFLFNLWDSNHDSFLSREEFVQFLSTSQNVETLGDEMISNIWSGLDVSEDGLVSLSEAKRGVAKLQVSCRAFSIDDDLNHANLSVEERDVAALLGRRVPLVKGTNIISQGELKTKFYILSEGSVTIQRNGIEIEKVVEGGLFGCEALLASEYGVTAVASSDVVILSINFSDMYPLVAHDHKGASRLSHRAGSTLMKLYSAISTIGATHTSISKDVDFILYKERIMQKVALFYHSVGKNGKLEIQATKGVGSPQDLSVAYSPGVAEPCLAIKDDPDKAYDYTSKGHLVGVVSNGTAVLGLGNIGALASKPVMEGKAVLFKTFGGLDSFDIELDQPDPEKFIEACVALAPTFGGINIEDVKAPECFYIEPEVQRRVNIPIMHDDAHGTAIIGGAGLLNALKVVKKDIGDIKVVVCGTGAAGFTSAKYFVSLGVKKENLIGVDKDGVIYHGRPDLDGDNAYLKVIASDSPLRTLQEVVVGADVFLGVSLGNILTPEMLLTMNKDPIVFALANPTPEINYTVAKQTRNDVIVASGRSDYPNQINNVVAFPYIFRGAIDVRSRAINEEMKKAATAAIAAIAESDSKRFGREYLIPGPGDPRLKIEVSAAVAQAAFDSGVAGRKSFDVQKYRRKLADEE